MLLQLIFLYVLLVPNLLEDNGVVQSSNQVPNMEENVIEGSVAVYYNEVASSVCGEYYVI